MAHGILLTQDPIGLAGGVNLYEYAGSNPVSFDDPFGLECPVPGTCTQSDVPYRSRFSQLRQALSNVLKELGVDGPLKPKGPSKHGNPNKTRGDTKRGYRLDPPHDPDKGGSAGSGGDVEHISWWDYTRGKRKSGKGKKEHMPIQYEDTCMESLRCPGDIRLPFVVTPAPIIAPLPVLTPGPVLIPVVP